MGVVQKHVKGVGHQVGEIVDRQLFQGAYHGSGVAGRFYGKAVRLKLVSAGPHLRQDPQEEVYWRIEHAEEDQPGVNRGLLQVKRVEQALE